MIHLSIPFISDWHFLNFSLNYLDRRISCGMPSSKGEDWQPLQLYRNSLLHGETDQPMPTAKRAYTRKKKEGIILIPVCYFYIQYVTNVFSFYSNHQIHSL